MAEDLHEGCSVFSSNVGAVDQVANKLGVDSILSFLDACELLAFDVLDIDPLQVKSAEPFIFIEPEAVMIMNIKIGDESGDSAEGGTLNDCEEEVEVLALTERILIGLGEFFIVFGGTGPDAIFDCFMNVVVASTAHDEVKRVVESRGVDEVLFGIKCCQSRKSLSY